MPKTYSIVASNYIDGALEKIAKLKGGEALTLVREPTNKFDRNAVAIYLGEDKIGYVPKAHNLVLAQFIDQSGVELPVSAPLPPAEAGPGAMAADAAVTTMSRAVPGKFVRSPNSAFPQVEV